MYHVGVKMHDDLAIFHQPEIVNGVTSLYAG